MIQPGREEKTQLDDNVSGAQNTRSCFVPGFLDDSELNICWECLLENQDAGTGKMR